MLQILELIPAIVNVSNIKPIYPPLEYPDMIIDALISSRIHASMVFAL
jgi:hypothetical protein